MDGIRVFVRIDHDHHQSHVHGSFPGALKLCPLYSLVILLTCFFLSCAIHSKDNRMHLPKTVLSWALSDESKAVTEKTIFRYMDGAGELYIGYRFDHLDVHTYWAPNREDILVELYRMKSSDDAFGLLSLDWTGESISINDSDIPKTKNGPVPNTRFLYGAGLLRIWSDDLYARIMTFPETPESRDAVLQIGRSVVSGRKNVSAPAFLNVLPLSLSGGWNLQPGKVEFLRTYLVLNSIYFLSFSNILDLDLTCEVAAARYKLQTDKGKAESFQLFVIGYTSPGEAKRALTRFHKIYFPEISINPKTGVLGEKPYVLPTEGKWSGYFLQGRMVLLCFESPDRSIGEAKLNEIADFIRTQKNKP